MDTALTIAVTTLTSPMMIFFMIGVTLAAMSRQLSMPPVISRPIAFLLLFAIGVKGGASVSEHGIDADLLSGIFAGIFLSVAMTVLAFLALRSTTRVASDDAAALAAHYGSISIVTFATMTVLLKAKGVPYDGWMVAVAAMMEVPAILTALLIAKLAAPLGALAAAGAGADRQGTVTIGSGQFRQAVGTVMQSGPVLLLLGAFVLGWAAGELGGAWQDEIATDLFPIMLCIFLLDQGLRVGRRLTPLIRRFDPRLTVFAVAMPLAGAVFGIVLGVALGFSAGNTALFAALAASASYIAAPAVSRVALPGARPEIYLTQSLCITLPFNLIIGLPLYLAAAKWLAG